MKMIEKNKKILLEAQDKLNQARQLFDDFKFEYCERLNPFQECILEDTIYELETIEYKVDEQFELMEEV